MSVQKIFIGADHRGFLSKKKIVERLSSEGYTIEDLGTHVEGEMCDYPMIALAVAGKVAKSRNAYGILLCMSGLGQAIAANKVPGAYAALCYNAEAAAFSRQHNNANVLVLGTKYITEKQMFDIVHSFLNAKFEGGRHLRRVKQIKKIEKEFCCIKNKKSR